MSGADTIYALSTAPGRAGVAVLRISGAKVRAIITALTGKPVPPARSAQFCTFHDAAKNPVDKGLLLFFEAPRSFTGEDVAELHVHGSKAVIAALFSRLGAFSHTRMAEAGEFTRRAFSNGKLDLAEAEGLADLIAAETEAQRKQALAQMDGALSKLCEGWRAELLRALAHIEADIDFSDEDLPENLVLARMKNLQALHDSIAAHLADGRRGERLRDGFSLAVLGAPNAGKSSFINTLSKREAAIVSAIPGTTRDVIEVHLDLGGYPVILADTAGLRPTQDVIEAEGVRRATLRAENADVKIILFDALLPPDDASQKLIDEKTFVVVNKIDLLSSPSATPAFHAGPEGKKFFVSTKTGEGMPALLNVVSLHLKTLAEAQSGPPPTRARHREALQHTVLHIAAALQGYSPERLRGASEASAPQSEWRKKPPEIIAEELRLATRALGRITGRVDAEDLLDIIFRDFCIGK